MKQFIPKLNIEINSKLHAIGIEETALILKAQKSNSCIRDILSKFRMFIAGYTFRKEEEIYFFKVIKPEIVSQVVCHSKIICRQRIVN